ncbi:MAG: hypothetical protein RL559_848 [Pseudomonadota bacterium]|jgi:hypothetical protein
MMFDRLRVGAAVCLLGLAACSPDQNWRQVNFDGARLRAQLPCKPDRTQREVPLGGVPVPLQVVGCESDNAMLVVMTAALPAGADVQAVLQGWRALTLRHLQAEADPGQARPWVGAAWLPLAAAVHQTVTGRRADGQAVSADLAWAAAAEGDHVRVVHAAVYAPRPRPDLAQGLMEGLQP